MPAGHVYYIQITQYRVQQRLQMISPSVASKKLRSRIWTGIVGSLSHGYLFKFPKVSKVCVLHMITYNLHHHCCNDFSCSLPLSCLSKMVYWSVNKYFGNILFILFSHAWQILGCVCSILNRFSFIFLKPESNRKLW